MQKGWRHKQKQNLQSVVYVKKAPWLLRCLGCIKQFVAIKQRNILTLKHIEMLLKYQNVQDYLIFLHHMLSSFNNVLQICKTSCFGVLSLVIKNESQCLF